ncbi:MAG: DNA cytosine methyltransferase [Lachnospiraceae bacterium]|nr:DNA cytosine methyltransferase [Lachnospiraceae bacterium]
MIFQRVTELQNNADKNYFKEKIDIYTKIVFAVCKNSNLQLQMTSEEKCYIKLKEMGLVDGIEDMTRLKKFLMKDKYYDLLSAVATEILYSDIISPFVLKLNNTRRLEMQKAEKERKGITLVDLFCGAGGLGLGFRQNGYKIVFANDFEQLCIETYRYNHPEIPDDRIVCDDIRKISEDIDKYFSESVDIVIGGPPCQGFSSANKHHRVIDDPRNELYKYFLRCVEKLCPKIVVMENVKGMLKVADQVVEDYESIHVVRDKNKYSYSVAYRLLLSSDFSVAQSRERLIYIAVRNDISDKHNIKPENIFTTIEHNNKGKPQYNLSSALEGVRPLLAPHMMGVGEVDTEEGGRKIDVNPYEGTENDYLKLINEGRNMSLVFNHKARYCSELNQEIYSRMNPGDDATDSKIADIMPYAHRNDKFKDKYFRLYGDRPCRTITAHLRSDCHSHIHPYEDRAITPREAARVQSFPDDYLFMGPYLKTYIQIGNAVPVVMARGIAEAIKPILEDDVYEN